MEPNNINETLNQRGSQYGDFEDFSAVCCRLKEVIRSTDNYYVKLSASQKEALDMIAHKITRILTGNPDYIDSWHDIAGYATCEERVLCRKLEKKRRDNDNSLPVEQS